MEQPHSVTRLHTHTHTHTHTHPYTNVHREETIEQNAFVLFLGNVLQKLQSTWRIQHKPLFVLSWSGVAMLRWFHASHCVSWRLWRSCTPSVSRSSCFYINLTYMSRSTGNRHSFMSVFIRCRGNHAESKGLAPVS